MLKGTHGQGHNSVYVSQVNEPICARRTKKKSGFTQKLKGFISKNFTERGNMDSNDEEALRGRSRTRERPPTPSRRKKEKLRYRGVFIPPYNFNLKQFSLQLITLNLTVNLTFTNNLPSTSIWSESCYRLADIYLVPSADDMIRERVKCCNGLRMPTSASI